MLKIYPIFCRKCATLERESTHPKTASIVGSSKGRAWLAKTCITLWIVNIYSALPCISSRGICKQMIVIKLWDFSLQIKIFDRLFRTFGCLTLLAQLDYIHSVDNLTIYIWRWREFFATLVALHSHNSHSNQGLYITWGGSDCFESSWNIYVCKFCPKFCPTQQKTIPEDKL